MPYDPDSRRDALLKFMHQFGFSARRLAAVAGLSPSAVTQFLKGHSRSLTDETYVLLAEGASKDLGWPVDAAFLRGERTHGIPLYVPEKIDDKIAKPPFEHFIPWEKVAGIVPCGKVGQSMMHVSALLMPNQTMSPWREADDIVLLDHGVNPGANSHAVFELQPAKGTKAPFLPPMLIAKVTSDEHLEGGPYELLQYNPRREITLTKSHIFRVHRVVEWPEVIFGPYPKSRIQWFDARFSKRPVDDA